MPEVNSSGSQSGLLYLLESLHGFGNDIVDQIEGKLHDDQYHFHYDLNNLYNKSNQPAYRLSKFCQNASGSSYRINQVLNAEENSRGQ